jgi:hypothetical protein
MPRFAPSTIASISEQDLGAKSMVGVTPASTIIAQWASWRRQACEHMLLSTAFDRDSEILPLASIQTVSTMLQASFLRARAAGDHDDDDDGRRASKGDGDGNVEQGDTPDQPGRQETRDLQGLSTFAHRSVLQVKTQNLSAPVSSLCP